jgi:hypothetical protein
MQSSIGQQVDNLKELDRYSFIGEALAPSPPPSPDSENGRKLPVLFSFLVEYQCKNAPVGLSAISDHMLSK